MISERMEKALNEQIAIEGHSSFVYLSIASWCDKEGLEGCNQFFRRQTDDLILKCPSRDTPRLALLMTKG